MQEREKMDNVEEMDKVVELRCNLDDMTGEELSYAMDKLLEAGALDVYSVPVGMKKSRTGIMLSVLCKEEQKKIMAHLLFQHTTTLGVREYVCNRMILKREEDTISTEWGPVGVKRSFGYGVMKEKPEYEDLKRIADENGLSIRQVRERIL
jgi:hypothetical protein